MKSVKVALFHQAGKERMISAMLKQVGVLPGDLTMIEKSMKELNEGKRQR